MQDFVVAVGQWPVVTNRDDNLALAQAALREAKAAGAALAVLPEMFQTPYDTTIMAERAEGEDGPSLRLIRALARELDLTVVAGSICERHEGRLYNSSYVLGPDGHTLGVHRKIHLFDVDLPTVRMQESAVLSAGDRPLVVETPLTRLGVAICYDVRFHDVFRYFARQGVEVVALPAAFSQTTGRAHWHALMRSRAIDYQVYLAAACPAPTAGASYVCYGHSLLVDPWGEVLAEADEAAQLITARISASRLNDVRRQLPLGEHRRSTLYSLWA